jgi:Skp family chaperone for outer membrane proteins
MKKIFAILAVLAMSAGISAAQGIGIIDANRASQSYWKFQSDTKSLTEEQQRLQELQQQIRGSVDQLNKEIEAARQEAENPGLSEDRKAAAKKEAEDKTQQIAQYQTSFQMQVQRFQQRAQAAQAAAEADVVVSIKKVSKANNLDAVFLAQAAPYAKIDITDQVIEDLNSTQPKDLPAPAAPAPAAAPAAPAAAK